MSKFDFDYTDEMKIPSTALGTAMNSPSELSTLTELALKLGFRHFDVACVPEIEEVVGKVINEWILCGKVKRDDVFVAAKLPPHTTKPKHVKLRLLQSLINMRLKYVDLYLVSSPIGLKSKEIDGNGNPVIDNKAQFMAMWPGMEAVQAEGLTRSLGVAHCNLDQMTRLLSMTSMKPSNLQVELHPYLQQRALVEFCKKQKIVLTAIVPTNMMEHKIPDFESPLENNEILKSFAGIYNKTVEQIVLKWLNQREFVALSQDLTVYHLTQCLKIFDFDLNPDQMKTISAFQQDQRFILPPFLTGLDFHSEFPFN